jgi:hypothetical protein
VEPALPVVLVRGGSGSAAQLQSPAMRFDSNAYPNVVSAIRPHLGRTRRDRADSGRLLRRVMAQTGNDQIYVVRHSQGVFVMNICLNSSRSQCGRLVQPSVSRLGYDIARRETRAHGVLHGRHHDFRAKPRECLQMSTPRLQTKR